MAHDQGLSILYENKTRDKTLFEEVALKLTNCHIKGIPGEYFSVTILPESDQLIEIVADGSRFSYDILNIHYKVKRS